jgi:hypothetical protein
MSLLLALLMCLAQETAPARPSGEKRDEFVRIEVTCTALSGSSAYLDLGREAGLAPGDRMRLFPPTGAPRRGRITSVSRTSARAELEGDLEGLEIGLLGEVWVPRKRLEAPAPSTAEAPEEPEAAAPAAEEPSAPAHPPWTSPPEEWNHAQPLLAPAHGLAPEERPRRFDGRVYTSADWTSDDSGEEPRDFFSGALGFDGRLENPFGHGGELAFDAEYFARRQDTAGVTEDEDKLRIDRASYTLGGVRGARDRTEVGRFLQRELPSFGFLDGVEYVHQLGTSQRVGASVGFLPIPDDVFTSGDDVQAALFWRRASDEAQRVSYGAGYQKTWHQGAADRDLFAAEFELHPSAGSSLLGSALVDYYTVGDTLKDSGPELTQLFVNATLRTEGGHGLGLFLSRFRWPELERDEFPDVTAEEIAEAVSTRYGADGWLALSRRTQLYGRAEAWSDEDDSGGGGRLRMTWRDLPRRGDLLLAETFVNQSKFTSALGVRASARRRYERGSVDLSWDSTSFDQEAVDEDLLQHAVRGAFELQLSAQWHLAFYAETRFGDEQDALSIGFLLQRSFD